jgi:hypothetical protein
MTDATDAPDEIAGEVVADDGLDLVLVSGDKIAEVIAGMGELDTVETLAQTKHRIVAEMLAAETEDELWSELPTWSSKHNVGKTFEITDVRGVFKSRYVDEETGATGGFLACSAVAVDGANASPDQETGEIGEPSDAGTVGILSTSALRLAGRIGWYYTHGKLPVTLTIVKRGESAGGYPILDAELAG